MCQKALKLLILHVVAFVSLHFALHKWYTHMIAGLLVQILNNSLKVSALLFGHFTLFCGFQMTAIATKVKVTTAMHQLLLMVRHAKIGTAPTLTNMPISVKLDRGQS